MGRIVKTNKMDLEEVMAQVNSPLNDGGFSAE